MNMEKLEARLNELEAALKQTMANYNLLEGCKRETLYWIDQLKAKEQQVEGPELEQNAA